MMVLHGICFVILLLRCKYRIAEKEKKDFLDKPGLPVAVRDEIMHIFHNLSSEDLLKKCLHGFTQNNNECLNDLIWKILPKDVYVGSKIFNIGVASAIMSFTSGAKELCKVMEKLGMTPGPFTQVFCQLKDRNRIDNMNRKSSVEGKKNVVNVTERYVKASRTPMKLMGVMFMVLESFRITLRKHLNILYILIKTDYHLFYVPNKKY